jgi:hypothetical protein
MKIKQGTLVVFGVCLMALSISAQAPVIINDPTVEAAKVELSAAEQGLMDKSILPKVRAKLLGDACEETIEVSGRVQGAFTKAGANQTLIFYQFCQTGNGLGSVGVAVFENGRVAANVVSAESGWSADARVLPDINQNGVDEIALYYSGGMHQGAGGTGVDIMEFSAGGLKGIGWFQAEEFTETSPVMGYKVSVKPGKSPTFLREKYIQNAAGKWRKSGMILPLKLKKIEEIFEAL